MNSECRLDVDNLKEQIKYLAAKQGITMNHLKQEVNSKYNKTDSVRNLGNKLRNKTFRVSELAEIADILGYEKKKKKKAV